MHLLSVESPFAATQRRGVRPKWNLAAYGQTADCFHHRLHENNDQTRSQRFSTFHNVPMKPVRMPSRCAVRAAIAASLRHGGASLQRTANQLGVSVRSLQRHLGEMGTSYSEVVAEVRLGAACRLLVESNVRISDIALRLGYAGPSSFSRTFMRLMKIQPAIYRQQQRNGKVLHGKSSPAAGGR